MYEEDIKHFIFEVYVIIAISWNRNDGNKHWSFEITGVRCILVMVVELHVEFLLDDSCGLVLLLVMDVEANGGVGIQAESLLQHLANPQD